jgi:hypothetical protein
MKDLLKRLLEENKEMHVTYYGWRIPFMGLFPNIVGQPNKHNLIYYDNQDVCHHKSLVMF